MALVVRNLPANAGGIRDMGSVFLGQEDPLEEAMATQSSILAWRIPWTEELIQWAIQSLGSQSWIQLSMHAHHTKNHNVIRHIKPYLKYFHNKF